MLKLTIMLKSIIFRVKVVPSEGGPFLLGPVVSHPFGDLGVAGCWVLGVVPTKRINLSFKGSRDLLIQSFCPYYIDMLRLTLFFGMSLETKPC